MPATLQTRCRGCRVELRIAVRAPCAIYGCPRCRVEFEAAWRDQAFQIAWLPPAAPPPVEDDDAPLDVAGACRILAVAPTDDAQTVKQAWRRACQRYHPDHHMQLPERLREAAHREIQRINAAYALLSRASADAGR